MELDVTSDQKIYSTNFITLTATPPPLSFWHLYNLESTYDGGVVEISTDGTVWTDLQPHILTNGYTATMDASTLLAGRRAWTGSSNNKFIKTKVDLSSYANQSVKFRFRMTSDVGTNPEGWYIDDIAIKDQAVVEMTSNFFTQAGIKVATSDTITIITPPVSCAGVTITSQVTNANICSGNDAGFTIAANGDTPTYQWQVSMDGGNIFTDIPGATAANLTLTGVTAGMNNYQYHVVISNTCPSTITSNNAILTVSDPANITAQPTNFTACAGTDGNFSITATGTANSYQWQVSTDGGNIFTNIVGATAATLTLTGVTAVMNNYQYHVIVSSCSPTALTSSNVTLTVNSPASITAQPVNVTACPTTDATFTAQVTGTNITYQWQVSMDGGTTFTDITGATAASLTISPVTATQNNYQYHVVISNICTASFSSSNATLTVSNNASITTQPVSTTACAGSNISFSTTASGTGYQWEVSTDGFTFTPVTGATNPTLDLSAVTIAMNGNQYHLVVSTCGPNSIISNNVTLTVVTPATIASQPGNEDLCEESNASFTVSTTGTAITYQWEFSTDNGVSYNPVPGATAATLNLTGVTVGMDGYLYRVVLNNFCTVNFTSSAAVLRVSLVTVINTQPADQGVCEGSDANFTIAASGTASGLTYQWQISTDGGTNFSNISGSTNATLTLTGVTPSMNNNRYRVVVSGCDAQTSTGALLTVNALPVVTISASPYINLTTDLTTTLTATANPPASAFSWFKNDVPVAGATTSTLNVQYADLGAYKASVTDGNGCTNISNIITIADSVVNIAFIYPNPNTGFFQVRYQGVEFNGQPRIITMFDGKGARVLQQSYATVTSYQVMDVHGEHLSSAVYALILSDASGKTLGTGKVIIRR